MQDCHGAAPEAKVKYPKVLLWDNGITGETPDEESLRTRGGAAALIFSCASAFTIEFELYSQVGQPADDDMAESRRLLQYRRLASRRRRMRRVAWQQYRTLSLKGGGTIVERLLKWDADGKSYTYAIVSSPLPVKNYVSTIKVVPDGNGSDVIWTGKYKAVKGTSHARRQEGHRRHLQGRATSWRSKQLFLAKKRSPQAGESVFSFRRQRAGKSILAINPCGSP